MLLDATALSASEGLQPDNYDVEPDIDNEATDFAYDRNGAAISIDGTTIP